MKVLIVGSGGREHAIAAAVARSARPAALFIAPGNAGTRQLGRNVPIAATDLNGLVRFACEAGIDLTIVGPESPLAAGLVDRLQAQGKRAVGPCSSAARLESSKAWAKAFMQRHGIPTAPFAVAHAAPEALETVRRLWRESGLVIKASGLAAGKGVVVAETRLQALSAVAQVMGAGHRGPDAETVVIEERLIGPEVSLMVALDGASWRLFPTAQDHKALLDGDLGPNTGGMGAYAPVDMVSAHGLRTIEQTIVAPLVAGLQAEGIPYRGFLFLGLMMTPAGPQVLEFNCRLGDPEAQVLLPGLESDVIDLCEAIVDGHLADHQPLFDGFHRMGVVACAPGYPHGVTDGAAVHGLDLVCQVPDVSLYHGGTAINDDGDTIVTGGRVLTVVGQGRSLEVARRRAYEAIGHVWLGRSRPHYRTDIGFRALMMEVPR